MKIREGEFLIIAYERCVFAAMSEWHTIECRNFSLGEESVIYRCAAGAYIAPPISALHPSFGLGRRRRRSDAFDAPRGSRKASRRSIQLHSVRASVRFSHRVAGTAPSRYKLIQVRDKISALDDRAPRNRPRTRLPVSLKRIARLSSEIPGRVAAVPAGECDITPCSRAKNENRETMIKLEARG